MAPNKWTDEWHEQGVRCRVYPKKGQRDVPEYVECWVSKTMRFTVFVKSGETPQHAAANASRFKELATNVAGCSRAAPKTDH